jgi:hypothetical protein
MNIANMHRAGSLSDRLQLHRRQTLSCFVAVYRPSSLSTESDDGRELATLQMFYILSP